ncbi:MAG: bacterial low temperature requirement A protein-domain-containing protein [Monoraphidium minutum]|nr:MAG: bacterial low temperature requirement A protein-domain-containing protein [Monoraphidium minutum]
MQRETPPTPLFPYAHPRNQSRPPPVGSDHIGKAAGVAPPGYTRMGGGEDADGGGDSGGGSGGGGGGGGGGDGVPPLRRFWAPPVLMQDWCDAQGERSATWTELFFDLFLVGAVSAVVQGFVGDPSWSGAGRFLLYLGLFHFTWTSSTHVVTRIHKSGLAFDALRLLRHLGVLGMTLAAQGFDSYRYLFAGSYLLVRAASLATFVALAAAVPRARAFAGLLGGLHLAMAALALVDLLAGPHLPDPPAAHAALFGAVLLLEAAAPAAVTAVPAAHLPLHVEHVDERLGLLQIIYLGESIVALGTSKICADAPALQVLGIALGCVVVWALFMALYHLEADQHNHALRQGRLRGLAFQYLHFLLGVAFNGAGAGLLMSLETYTAAPAPAGGGAAAARAGAPGGAYRPAAAWTLCACYGAALHLVAALRATHFLPLDRRPRAAGGAARGDAPAVKALGGGGVAGDAPAARRVDGRLRVWVAFAVVWPMLAYALPLLADPPGRAGRLRTTGLLGCVAAHAVIYIAVETAITASVVSEVEAAADGGGGDGGGGGAGEAESGRSLLEGMEAPTA